jgi:hypothetical protein
VGSMSPDSASLMILIFLLNNPSKILYFWNHQNPGNY